MNAPVFVIIITAIFGLIWIVLIRTGIRIPVRIKAKKLHKELIPWEEVRREMQLLDSPDGRYYHLDSKTFPPNVYEYAVLNEISQMKIPGNSYRAAITLDRFFQVHDVAFLEGLYHECNSTYADGPSLTTEYMAKWIIEQVMTHLRQIIT